MKLRKLYHDILLSRVMVSLYGRLSKQEIDEFYEHALAKRFDHFMEGVDRERIAEFVTRPPTYIPVIEEVGKLNLKVVGVNIADTTEPEVKTFTKEDVDASKGVLAPEVANK